MILAVSTSGPEVQVAVWGGSEWVKSGYRTANRNSSAAVMGLLEELEVDVSAMEGFLADVGPGSFSGVRVGVTMVKTWGFAFGKPVFAVDAFDLVSREVPVAIGSKRGEVYYRSPGEEPVVRRIDDLEGGVVGCFPGVEGAVNPDFRRIRLPEDVREVAAVELVPLYVAAPSISQPKQAHIMGETFKGG